MHTEAGEEEVTSGGGGGWGADLRDDKQYFADHPGASLISSAQVQDGAECGVGTSIGEGGVDLQGDLTLDTCHCGGGCRARSLKRA